MVPKIPSHSDVSAEYNAVAMSTLFDENAMKSIQLLVVSTVLSLSVASDSTVAAIVLSIEPTEVAPGSTALVSFNAYSDADDRMSAFNIPLELGNDGSELPAGFALAEPPLQNVLFSNFTLNRAQNSFWGIDGIANADGQVTILSVDPMNPTKLFDLAIQVTDAVSSGAIIPVRVEDIFLLATAPSPLKLPSGAANQILVSGPALAGDCNGDGLINVDDLSCVCNVTNGLSETLAHLGLPPGDFDKNQQVDFPDFLVLSANFGNPGGYLQGDIDCSGTIDFPDFLILANGFGEGVNTSTIPEPTGSMLIVLLPTLIGRIHRRHTVT